MAAFEVCPICRGPAAPSAAGCPHCGEPFARDSGRRERLLRAAHAGRAGFGAAFEGRSAFRAPPQTLDEWVVNGDGTVTDTLNRRRWVQAPWGMIFRRAGFAGEPIALSWRESTELFGRASALRSLDGFGTLLPHELPQTVAARAYRRGCCGVRFAGYSDWRLPTAVEWRTVLPNGAAEPYDLWRARLHRLFPAAARLERRFWSASAREHERGWAARTFARWLRRPAQRAAWAFDFHGYAETDMAVRHPVLLIRDELGL